MFVPKLFVTLKDYNRKQFFSDVIAGIIVGIVALPLAIAFAIASGVSPEKGLYTAIIAGFIISALGGSRVQIGGPTGAFIVIVYGIVQRYGIDGLSIATIIAGFMLLGMGFARLGSVIKFIPYPLIVGFTSGIALIIFSSEIKDFFGIKMGAVPADFIEKWTEYFKHFDFINWPAVILSIGTILVTVWFSKITHHIPGSLVAILLATAATYFLKLPVETIGTRFGAIPSSLPSPHIGHIDIATIKHLIQPAFTIALLGAIESLLSAVVADGMIGGNHKSNMELVAQGVANIVSPIFGGIPATGAIARTATNVKNGGRTPIAGIIHALTLLVIMVLIGKWATLIPLPCLAGILVVVAYNMSEWRSFVSIIKSSRSDAAVLLATFLLTVLVDLTVAIEVGMVLAAFLFMRSMTQISNVGLTTKNLNDSGEGDDPMAIHKYKIPKEVEVFEANNVKNCKRSANMFSLVAVCVLLGILFSSSPATVVLGYTFIIIAYVLFVLGLIYSGRKTVTESSDGKKLLLNRGVTGFVLSIIGVLLLLTLGFFALLTAGLGGDVAFGFFFLVILSLFLIGAFITSIRGSNEKTDKHPILGSIGVVIGVLSIIALLLLIINLISFI